MYDVQHSHIFFFQAEDGIRDVERSRGLGDVYKRQSMGLFVYYFGTKKIYENVEHHTIKFGNKYKEHLDDIFDKKILNNDISYYLHRPTATAVSYTHLTLPTKA